MYVVLLYQYSFIEIFLSFSNHASNVQRCDYLPLQKVVGAAAHNDEAKWAGVSAVQWGHMQGCSDVCICCIIHVR